MTALNSTTWHVLVVHVTTKYDKERMEHTHRRLKKELGQDSHEAMHGDRSFAVVCLTMETTEQLFGRLLPLMEKLDGVDNFWVVSAPTDLIGRYGRFDPLQFRSTQAQVEARARNDRIAGRRPRPRNFSPERRRG